MKSIVNQPICVAEVNILKLHFSLFVEKTPCIYFIFHLQERTHTEYINKVWIMIHRTIIGQFQKDLFVFFEKLEHAFHVNEWILDHPEVKKEQSQ